MTHKLTPSALRQNIYKIFDQVAKTGEPIFIERNGVTIKISVTPVKKSKLANLKKRKIFVGDPEDIVHIDWSEEWSES